MFTGHTNLEKHMALIDSLFSTGTYYTARVFFMRHTVFIIKKYTL